MDVAFKVNERGKLTFARSEQGDFYLDDRAVYAVFSTLLAHKGEYAFDASVGTNLHLVRKDGRTTRTRLVGAATDALDQCRRQEQVIQEGDASAERLRVGIWTIPMRWRVASGEVREKAPV